MRILVIIPGRQVEVLQASPLIRTLAVGLAESTITVACSPRAAAVAARLEGVAEVVPVRGLDPGWSPWTWARAWLVLRRRRFDTAIICGTETRARLLPFASGIPRRLGPATGLSGLLLSDHIAERLGENRSASWLRLAHLLGVAAERHAPRLEPGAEASRQALVQLHSSGIADGRLLVALAPGTGHSDLVGVDAASTAWDPERWAHLANQLAVRHGAGVVFIGTAEDQEAVQTAVIDVAAPHADICGELDVMGIAALLGLCDLVVGGDSALLHMAAAVGTPAVGLFGPTSGRRRGPYGEEHRVVQALAGPRESPAGGRSTTLPPPLMGRIRVEDVLAGIEIPL